MARGLDDLLSPPAIGLASLGLLVLGGSFLALRARRRKRPTQEQLELARREWLSKYGKLGGGEILEVQENTIAYLYEVRGLTYTTEQDVSALPHILPPNRWSIIGGVGVRYDPRNPANSIVISESWTGLRSAKPGKSA